MPGDGGGQTCRVEVQMRHQNDSVENTTLTIDVMLCLVSYLPAGVADNPTRNLQSASLQSATCFATKDRFDRLVWV